ncbi:MAG: NUDIX domain-containing protein [Patescibacteria group bacterium]|nr:NUDIX domain-containing protein [Patescibacteria group bacterium]
MKKKRSLAAGIIVVHRNTGKVLILFKRQYGIWEYSKGKIERGESEMRAARREAGEEIGIKNIEIEKGFREIIHYRFRAQGCLFLRTVTYFLGFTRERIRLSREHSAYKWCTFKEASRFFKHRNYKYLLRQAEKYVQKNSLRPIRK